MRTAIIVGSTLIIAALILTFTAPIPSGTAHAQNGPCAPQPPVTQRLILADGTIERTYQNGVVESIPVIANPPTYRCPDGQTYQGSGPLWNQAQANTPPTPPSEAQGWFNQNMDPWLKRHATALLDFLRSSVSPAGFAQYQEYERSKVQNNNLYQKIEIRTFVLGRMFGKEAK
jgi:hypothetical protein